MDKKFCPILAIGFGPPNENERDMRLCMKDCMWYNETEETCNLNYLAEIISNIELSMSDIMDNIIESSFNRYDYDIDTSDY